MFIRLLKKISRELVKAKIPYMVIGGQAVLIYGEPRLTKDIDITLGVGIEELEIIINLLNKIELKTLVDNVEDFVRKTMVLHISKWLKDFDASLDEQFFISFEKVKKEIK